jgi:hypothetical protein
LDNTASYVMYDEDRIHFKAVVSHCRLKR